MTGHKTKLITVKNSYFPDGISGDIDLKIVPLIKKLWELGLETINSCEDNVPEGWVWIQFASPYEATKFLDIVAKYNEDSDSMYNRIRQAWESSDDSLFWKYDVLPVDCGVEETLVDEEIEEKFTGKSDFVFTFSIRFPQSDLKEIMKNLKTN